MFRRVDESSKKRHVRKGNVRKKTPYSHGCASVEAVQASNKKKAHKNQVDVGGAHVRGQWPRFTPRLPRCMFTDAFTDGQHQMVVE